jgi:hypothetical protein
VRRFVDPAAEILFVEPEEVILVQERERAIGFDAPGAAYPHRDDRGRCSFEVLVEENFPADAALGLLAKIVHGADFPAEMDIARESAGLWAVSQGFTDVGRGDAEILDPAAFLYDSLYAHLKRAESK